MKKLIFISLCLISLNCFATTKMIILEKTTDTFGVTYIQGTIYKNNDGSPKYFRLTATSDLTNVAKIAIKTITGLSKNTDRLIIYFNPDGTVDRIHHFVRTTLVSGNPEQLVLTSDNFTTQYQTDTTTVQTTAEAQ